MPEILSGHKAFSLLEVCKSIEKTIKNRYGTSFWVKAEINKLNHYPHSGHAYPELVEKRESKVLAEIRSVIWKSRFEEINERFQKLLGEPLKDGIEVLFEARVNYSPKYGLSLHILDIDPAFTLGELQKEKQECIRKLKEEGVYDQNRSLKLALLPQRIAVISVETSKGYADFLKVIDQNAFGYKFFHMLFPALLQGEKAGPSIIKQLQLIEQVKEHFDLVCIIRGGGGDVGLSSFNDYKISRAVATFPLPVLSGIGHSTNETVTEMVSFRSAITPTELGDFLLQAFHNFSVPVQDAQKLIRQKVPQIISEEHYRFMEQVKGFRYQLVNRLQSANSELKDLAKDLRYQVGGELRDRQFYLRKLPESIRRSARELISSQNKSLNDEASGVHQEIQFIVQRKNETLDHFEKLLKVSDPANTLKLGYSITRHQGRAITNAKEVKKGEEIETIFADGSVTSEVKKSKNG